MLAMWNASTVERAATYSGDNWPLDLLGNFARQLRVSLSENHLGIGWAGNGKNRLLSIRKPRSQLGNRSAKRIRKPVLYPTELRAQSALIVSGETISIFSDPALVADFGLRVSLGSAK